MCYRLEALQTDKHLPRVLKYFDVSVLASASMGPAYSLASTMGPMVAAAGSATPLTLVALSAIMLCISVAFASLSRVSPDAGSSYSWIRMAFGDYVGAYGAWLLILSNFFATMAIAVPAGVYTLELFAPARAQDPLSAAIVGAVWIVASSVLLYVGIRPTAVITFAALGFEMIVLFASAIAAYIVHPAAHVVVQNAHAPLIPVTFGGFVAAMTLGVWVSDGWEVSASTSEEIDDNATASGRGGITGLVFTTIILLICTIAYLHIGTPGGFAANQADSLAYVSDLLGGGLWRYLIVVTVMLSTLTTLWTTILYLSRSVFAMGRDAVMPRALGKLDRRDEPFWALFVVAALTTVCELVTGFSKSAADQLTTVVNVSSVFLGLLFIFTAGAAVRRFWTVSWRAATVLVPLAGALALLAVLCATVWFEPRGLQWYALGGVVLGIPFALWRGPRVAAAEGRGSI